ncbi:MAG: carbohydrate-binding module family 20 domain-containing protein [Candidatus Latescibacteria bacterium]|nr:carbohydrate-binding module family 20 domain-containing protein [Candidatus Latescibacterota bacterium]
MKRVFLLSVLVLALAAGNAAAAIGWAGNVWPNSGAIVVPTGPVDVYAQVWKDGVTNAGGQGAGIEAFCDLSADGGAITTVPVPYFGDVGSNDEYKVQIPQAMLMGASYVDVHIKFHDLTDDTWYTDVKDQANNSPPQRYNVTNVLPVDVDVTFTLCMSGEATSGAPCVIGSAAVIGAWNTGVSMTSLGGDLYEVVVTFPAGGNPYFEYKFKKDGCNSWEGASNRIVTLPTDGTTSVVLAPDSWNNLPIGCGLGNTLDADRSVCLQVCLDGVDNVGGVCAIGSVAQLSNWGAGVPAVQVGPGLYQTCIVFPAGSAIPLTVEYKFKKDDCGSWENVGNRSFVVDNAMPGEQTLTSNWDDNGSGACSPVGNENADWGSVKSMYR